MEVATAVATRTAFSREKIELIKQTVAKGATDLELELFFHACQRTGLDPLMKQIYAIKRWSSADRREVMSFQTGIDGYRLIADRTGLYAGSDEPRYNGDDDSFLATVTVWKLVNGQRCGFTASARWDEYVQMTKDGQPTAMWKKMPYLMLAKCAEALALRKAFPAELSGVYTHEEMMQADVDTVPSLEQKKQTARAKIAELVQEGAAPAIGVSEAGADAVSAASGTSPAPTPAAPSDLATGMAAVMAAEVEHWCAKLKTALRSVEAINAVFRQIPKAIQQDCHGCYVEQLKGLKAKR
jgi:phage recombination protein Bet